jgi:hypothetical protein
VEKNLFFQCIGSHVFLKLLLGLKSTGWFSSNIIFLSGGFLAAAECVACFADLERR